MSDFSIGTAVVDITPPLGVSLAGYLTDRICEGVRDPLKARALVASAGSERVALVQCDLLGLIAPQVERIRAMAHAWCGIPPGNILVHCTHTHTGPRLPRYFVEGLGDLEADLYPGTVDEEYAVVLERQVASAIALAAKAMQPAPGMGWSIGLEASVSFNRRYRMKDGSLRTNPGIGNPGIAGPAGEIDPQVIAVAFGLSGPALVSHACHPDVIGGNLISADWPGHVIGNIGAALGQEARALFLNGTCGDINHVNVNDPDCRKGYAHSLKMGRIIAAEALKGLARARLAPVECVAAAGRSIPLKLRAVPDEERAAAEAVLADPGAQAAARSFAAGTLALARTPEREQTAEVQVVRIGDVAVVGLPGEIFVRLGLSIKEASPLPATIVCGLANGSMGYIPTEDAYAPGGYEAHCRSARFQPGSGERLVAAAVELLRA